MMENQDELQRVLCHLVDSHPEFANELAAAESLAPTISDFDVIRKIGNGGFGDVWLAKNRFDQSFVALKTFHDAVSGELNGVCEYKRRVKNHPHLVQIDHVGQSGEHLYYVMPLADNLLPLHGVGDPENYEPATLDEVVSRKGKLTVNEALKVANHILSALAALHAGGAIHRDVKPSNILCFDGAWKLGDPGLVVTTHAMSAPAGTDGYRYDGAETEQAVDLHALSITLEEVTEENEFHGNSVESKSFREILKRARRDGENRLNAYDSAIEMHREIEALLGNSNRPNTSKAIGIVTLAALGCLALFLASRWQPPSAVPSGQTQRAGSPSQLDTERRGDAAVASQISVSRAELLCWSSGTSSVLGKNASFAVAGDDLKLEVDLTEPTHLSVVAFDSTGIVNQLPEAAWTAKKAQYLKFPSSTDDSVSYKLDPVPGAQGFAVFLANKPIDQSVWQEQLNEIAWEQNDWSEPFWYATPSMTDFGPKQRGHITQIKPPELFSSLRGQLRQLAGVKLLYLCMFEVRAPEFPVTEKNKFSELESSFSKHKGQGRFKEANATLKKMLAAADHTPKEWQRRSYELWQKEFSHILSLDIDKREVLTRLAKERPDRPQSAIETRRRLQELLPKESLYVLQARLWESDFHIQRPGPDSERFLEEFASQCRQVYGKKHPRTLYATANLGFVQFRSAQKTSIELQRDSVTKLLAMMEKPSHNPLLATIRFADSLSRSSKVALLEESEKLAKISLDGFQRLGDTRNVGNSLSVLSASLVALARPDEAIELVAAEIDRQQSDDEVPAERTNQLIGELAFLQRNTGRFHESLKTYQWLHKRVLEIYPKHHFRAIASAIRVAARLAEVGRAEESQRRSNEIEALLREFHAPKSIGYQDYLGRIASLHSQAGRHEIAMGLYEELADIVPLSASNQLSVYVRISIVGELHGLNEFAKAKERLDELTSMAREQLGEDNWIAKAAASTIGSNAFKRGDFKAALAVLSKIETHGREANRWSHENKLGAIHFALGDIDKAVEVWNSIGTEIERQFAEDIDPFGNPLGMDDYSPRLMIAAAEASRGRFRESFRQAEMYRAGGLRHELSRRLGHGSNPLSIKEIQTELEEHQALVGWIETGFMSYAIPDHYWVYVLRSQGEVRFERVNALLIKDLEPVIASLTNPEVPFDTNLAKHLYTVRIRPAIAHLDRTAALPAATEIIAVSTGEMAGVPLQAIFDIANPNHGFAISHAFSGSVYARTRRRSKTKNSEFLVMANPTGDLPSAESNSHQLSQFFPDRSTVVSGASAAFAERLEQAKSGELCRFKVSAQQHGVDFWVASVHHMMSSSPSPQRSACSSRSQSSCNSDTLPLMAWGRLLIAWQRSAISRFR